MNLPNRITLSRILFVPLIMVVLLMKGIPYREYLAAGMFILAALTDGLDGYLARTRQQITKFGTFMDPLADKLLVSAALISLVELERISAWIAFLIIARELMVTGLRSVAASDGIVINASGLGKFKTVSQIVAIVALILEKKLLFIPVPIAQIALFFAVVFTLWSGYDYFEKMRRQLISHL